MEVTFILIPLLEKLKIGKIDVDLTEGQVFSTENDSTVWTREYKIERKVVQAVWNIPDEEPQDVMGQDGWTFTRSLELPKSMRDYVQSVECKGIRVRHRLKFVVSLHNPDGHVSEVSCSYRRASLNSRLTLLASSFATSTYLHFTEPSPG